MTEVQTIHISTEPSHLYEPSRKDFDILFFGRKISH